MANTPLLMPKATAVWLVDNTSLTFDQIADFCKLHSLEVKAIADGEAALTIKGLDPVSTGQLTREEIAKAEGDPAARLKMADPKVRVPGAKHKGPRYTPVSRRQDRPNAILWLLRNHPELKDAQIMRLVGTTKPTIESIRNRTHWNANNLQPLDPVSLSLCSQIDLDFEVERAARNTPGEVREPEGATLLPASQTTAAEALAAAARTAAQPSEREQKREEEREADAVFAKLQSLKGPEETPEE
jgi:uncharacterized protein